MHFYIINFDGIILGLKNFFCETWLEFDEPQDAIDIAKHWDKWINGMDV